MFTLYTCTCDFGKGTRKCVDIGIIRRTQSYPDLPSRGPMLNVWQNLKQVRKTWYVYMIVVTVYFR